MSKLTLTRHLYIYDEVIYSFIISLLKKQSIHECYFWIFELFSSGYIIECWEIIWFIYYDCYYINTPDFSWFINDSYNNGKENLKNIWTVVNNLFPLVISSHVFITRQYNMASKEIAYIYRGKKPNWLVNSIPSKYHALFRYINKKKYHFAVSSLPETININSDLFEAIRIYFNLEEDQMNSIQTDYHNSYNNDIHKIWSIICLLIFNPHYINSKAQTTTDLSEEEYQEILKIYTTPIPVNKYGEIQYRNTLTYKCLYSIHPLSSSFQLMRDAIRDTEININIRNCYCHHWEYYAYNSPIWKSRIDKYDIMVDELNRKIVFNDDDELEEFYGLYGYEPDELSIDVQNKLFGLLPNHNWKHLFEVLFPNELFAREFTDEVKFKDEFKFNY